MRNFFFTLFIISFSCIPVSSQNTSSEDRWVDSVYQTLNDTQRIGQLIMIRAHSNLGSDHIEQVEYLIKKYHVVAAE